VKRTRSISTGGPPAGDDGWERGVTPSPS
jgi:hypothetical protein